MNRHLQSIADFVQLSENLSAEEKNSVLSAIKNADKELEITAFKLDRTEKVKRTTAILLEETIEELELKRKSVEVQNRELGIESSLERVRTVAMGMNKPDDMLEICRTISTQLELLKIKDIRNVQTAIIYESKGTYINYEYYSKHDKQIVTEVDFKNHHLQTLFVKEMVHGAEEMFTRTIVGKEVQDWYYYQQSTNQFADYFLEKAESLSYYWYSLGPVALGMSTYVPLREEEINLFRRFRNVFDLAYRRFLDIQKAEAQAKEAQVELALERVRARTMAMQNSNELVETSTVLFHQLKILGVDSIRTGVATMDEVNESVEVWSTSGISGNFEKKILGVVPANVHPMFTGIFNSWKSKEPFFAYELKGDDLKKYYRKLSSYLSYPDQEIFNEREIIYTFFFPEGSLNVVSQNTLTEDECNLTIRFAKVFGLVYRRFLDLKQAEQLARQAELDLVKLKEEKRRTEEALSELKAAQAQLIQSEKMASLGELTAGIAHEIQNPLNFVNNFAEVCMELIDEMKQQSTVGGQQSAVGGQQSANEIMDDIRQNLEKINHHGKRADAIVKGMLQHSRTSSGLKEPTDINALADEYLRLAYHGLRAKDKDFNATLKTDFDESIGKINIIPQDIGRVILNLITNAFYAADEKKKQLPSDLTEISNQAGQSKYEPTVTVSSKRSFSPEGEGRGEVLITVQDNGNGIPQNILDKIFQPFFTTKPTGEGTGLGLSLSYDIVKAHGGRLKVETKEGEGTTFIMQIPILD